MVINEYRLVVCWLISPVFCNLVNAVLICCLLKFSVKARLFADVIICPRFTSTPCHFLSLWFTVSKRWMKTLNTIGSSYHSHSVIFLCNLIQPSPIFIKSKTPWPGWKIFAPEGEMSPAKGKVRFFCDTSGISSNRYYTTKTGNVKLFFRFLQL